MMNLDTVKAMSNKDLRIKAAELVGFTDIRLRFVPVPWLMDLVEEELSGYLDGKLQCIPDYLNDIAAAWGLAEHLPVDVDLRRNYAGRTWACGIGDLTVITTFAKTAQRAIAQAFVLAMTRGEKKWR